MKSVKFLFYVLVSVFVIFPILTFAETITNLNGIEISEEDYENFLKIHTHEYIMTMSEEKYEKLLSLDYDDIQSEEKYVVSIYNPNLNVTSDIELTEEEYDEFDVNNLPSLYLDTGATGLETTAKKMNLIVIGGNIHNYAMLSVTWKYLPARRSYDVIGFRGYGMSFRDGSQEGRQIYILNDVYQGIDYSWNGTNTKRFDNGYGISMNLVNSNITGLQIVAECDFNPVISSPDIYASYQHAVQNVSLANSQNYTLNGGGLGNVFLWPYNISQKYDGMAGLEINYWNAL